MRSFFTSSLDKIDPPSPYVNAMDWDSYRSQFRSEQSSKSGNRNCVLALGSLNPESLELSSRPNRQNIPLIVQNTLKNRFTIELAPELLTLAAFDVDACFVDGCNDFLRETNEAPLGTSWLEAPGKAIDESFDLELGLLESVQEIAVALTRTAPKRTTTTTQQPRRATPQCDNEVRSI